MSEPIFEQLIHHGEQDVDDIKRLWHDITGRHRRQPYDSRNDVKGPPMSALFDVEAKLKDFADDLTSKLEDIRQNAAPVIHDGAEALERLSKSPIVGELEQLAEPLDPALEALLAGMIKSAGDAAAKVAAMTAAAQPPAPAEAEPQPAGDVSPQFSGIAQ